MPEIGDAPTPLVGLPDLATELGIAALLVKDESRRPLGSFKSLGGMRAALRALSAADGTPSLVCASAGNHGLAVAAAARQAGAGARIFVSSGVSETRAARIRAQGAEVVSVEGTYDDAVRAAVAYAHTEHALLIADTSGDGDDPIVADVMDGYQVIASEVRSQLDAGGGPAPTHLFVQAGVGGLAAALASGLQDHLAAPRRVVVVEPGSANCVGRALAAGEVSPVPGSLATAATMLACAQASAPALAILRRHQVGAMAVDERALTTAPARLSARGGPATTPSGAAGLAGLTVALSDSALARSFELGPTACVLVVVTEGPEV